MGFIRTAFFTPQTPRMDGQIPASARHFKILSGTSNQPLVEEIARHLGAERCKVTCSRFADGEIFVRIDENIRGADVFVVQSTNPPAENMLELLLLIDAARRASAARITCVLPYFGYARQDRKDQPRVAIGAKLMANLLEKAGAEIVESRAVLDVLCELAKVKPEADAERKIITQPQRRQSGMR